MLFISVIFFEITEMEALFFSAHLSHFASLWLCSSGLRARHFYHLKYVISYNQGTSSLLKESFVLASVFFGVGACLELKAADAVNILHQSPENASQTNVPQRAFSLFISIRGVFSSTLVQWRLPNQFNVLLPIHFRKCTVLSLMHRIVGHC